LVELKIAVKKTKHSYYFMRPKHPSESLTTLTDLVLPSETNPLNNPFGGELLRMDRAASIARGILAELLLQHCQSRGFNRAIPLEACNCRS
jgi:acyl-CoA hydrolase